MDMETNSFTALLRLKCGKVEEKERKKGRIQERRGGFLLGGAVIVAVIIT